MKLNIFLEHPKYKSLNEKMPLISSCYSDIRRALNNHNVKYMITSSQIVTKVLILLIMIYILHEASCILFQSKFMYCS